MLKVKLTTLNLHLYYAWQHTFQNTQNISVIDDDIFNQPADAIVSPANSFGYMDGGLDLKISQRLGWSIEQKIRNTLEQEYFGELPVGCAIITATDQQDFPYIITAPTMRVPANVSKTHHAYLAFKAILQVIKRFNEQHSNSPIKTVACPGLGTGEGRMPADRCARQMKRAWEVVQDNQFVTQGGLAGAVEDHLTLLQ